MGTFPEPFIGFQCTVDVPEAQLSIAVQFLFSYGGAGSQIRDPSLSTVTFDGVRQRSGQAHPPRYLHIKL